MINSPASAPVSMIIPSSTGRSRRFRKLKITNPDVPGLKAAHTQPEPTQVTSKITATIPHTATGNTR